MSRKILIYIAAGWEYSNSIVLIGIEKLYYRTGDEKYLEYIKNHVDK